MAPLSPRSAGESVLCPEPPSAAVDGDPAWSPALVRASAGRWCVVRWVVDRKDDTKFGVAPAHAVCPLLDPLPPGAAVAAATRDPQPRHRHPLPVGSRVAVRGLAMRGMLLECVLVEYREVRASGAGRQMVQGR